MGFYRWLPETLTTPGLQPVTIRSFRVIEKLTPETPAVFVLRDYDILKDLSVTRKIKKQAKH